MSQFREKYSANPYDGLSPQERRRFKREDKQALAEITKRLRRFGYSDFTWHPSCNVHADWGQQPLAVFAKWQKTEDSAQYEEFQNATVKRVIYLSRNMQKKRQHQFEGDQLKYRRSFLPYKEILVSGGMLIDYFFDIIDSDDKHRRGHAEVVHDRMISVQLSDLMPHISGALRKRKPINRVKTQTRYYYNCITKPSQLTEFLRAPIRPCDLEHIPSNSPRSMRPTLY